MDIDDAIRPWHAHDNAAPGDPATADAQAERLRALRELGAAYVASGASAGAVPDAGAAARIEALGEWTARVLP
jgi:hypothetical protein